MTTAMEEQYVPEDFQTELDLPTAQPVDQAALGSSKAALTRAKLASRAAKSTVSTIERALKREGLSAKGKKALQEQLTRAQASYQKAVKAQTEARNKVYETGGEYEKLLEGANRDAFLALRTLFSGFGLGSLAGKIYDYAKQGYGADTISLLLQDTNEYKQRFAGNEARLKAGLPVLSPAEYLSVESAYRQVLQDAGLPKGFYDNPADFQKWISSDISPTEIKSRVDIATAEVSQFDDVAKQQLALFYGVDEKSLVAYALDRTRGVALLQKQASAAQFGAEAARRGLATDRTRMEGYISQGLSQSQAAQGFQIISEELPNLTAIAERFGTTFGQVEAEQAVFGTSAFAAEKRKGLASQERALFGGSQGSSAAGLSAGYRAT